jgi:uncharacterized membrane protein YfhO
VNSLLGIKYIIKKGGDLNSEAWVLEEKDSAGSSHIYENRYPLSLGFMVKDKVLLMEDGGGANPFEYQNDLIRRVSGVEDKLFVAQPVALVEYEGLDVTKNGYGNYTFENVSEEPTGSAVYTYDCVEGSALYGYANGTGGTCDTLEIKCGDDLVDSGKLIESYPIVFTMGNGQEGDTSTVRITSNKDHKTGNFKLMIYALNKEVFTKAYDELADEQLNITEFSDRKIRGELTAKEDGILFLSIPYEKGWKVYIDGERAETFKLLQAVTGVKVAEGSHDVRIEYTPEGFPLGVTITFISLGLVILTILADRRRLRKRRRTAPAEEAPQEELREQPPFNYRAEVYDQVCESLIGEDVGRVEDTEVILYDGSKETEKEVGDAQSESDNSLQGD